MNEFYRPTDVAAANVRFGASCGHAALAAILGCEVERAWRAGQAIFAGKSWVSAPAMEQVLRDTRPGNWRVGSSERQFPVRGLALLQWDGPWMAPGLPFGAQLARTHWVAVDRVPAGEMVYDINQDGWLPRAAWELSTIPMLLALHKRATGWHVRRTYEVQPEFGKGERG